MATTRTIPIYTMPSFRPQQRVTYNGVTHIVNYVTLRKGELWVNLVGVEKSVHPDKLVTEMIELDFNRRDNLQS